MTTSGVTAWSLTASEIITQACYELGTHAQGEVPSTQEMTDALYRLNGMLKAWQGEGNLFREKTTTIAFTAGTGQQTLSTDVRAVSNAWVVGTSYNRMLAQWNRGEYLMLPRPAQTGTPTAWYAETTNSGLILHVFPVPSVDTTIGFDYSKKAETVTATTQTVDIPEEWQEAVILGLASRMASMFGVTRSDSATVQRIDARASALFSRLMDRDRPDSYYFEPDV